MVIFLIEFVVMVLFFAFVISQLIIPSINGRPLCPMFRKTSKLENEIEQAQQDVYDDEVQEILNKVRSRRATAVEQETNQSKQPKE